MSSRTEPLRRSPRLTSSPQASPNRSRSSLSDTSFSSPRNTSINRVTRETTPEDEEDEVDSYQMPRPMGLNDSSDTLLLDVDGNDSPRKASSFHSPESKPSTNRGFSSPVSDGLARPTYVSPRRRVGVGAVSPESRRPASPKSPRIKGTSPKKPVQEDEGMSKRDLCLLCLGLLVGIILILYVKPILFSQPENPSSNDVEVLVKNFESGLKHLVLKFPSQDRRLWTGLLAVAKPILKDSHPIQPAVTILAFADSAKGLDTGRNISNEYVDLLSSIYMKHSSVVSITSHLSDKKPKDKLKLFIDNELQQHLNSGSKVVFVPNLDKMNGEDAKIFYGFCDNENAPFKRAHFVFTVGVPIEGLSDEETVDDRVENILSETWGNELDEDMFSALWSRIGNNVLLVVEEK